jgi:hypothetical protein
MFEAWLAAGRRGRPMPAMMICPERGYDVNEGAAPGTWKECR